MSSPTTPEPYYEQDGITIYHGDCREVLPGLGAFDAVVTDPPYGDTSLEWDRRSEGWVELICAPQVWCFGSLRFWLTESPHFARAGWTYGQEIVWEKHNGSGFHADRFKRVHELALHWYRGPWGDLYRDVPKTHDATRRSVRRKARTPHTGEIAGSTYTSLDGGPRLMRSVIRARSCHGNAVHPTQKPTSILDPLIRYSTPLGGTVVDPFAGSGSTAVAAKLCGRDAVLIEAQERYCEIAAKRLAQGVLPFADSEVPA